MSFTPFARYRNFTVDNLRALLEVYPDMQAQLAWNEAGDIVENKLSGYKKTAYQQACQLGLEDRSSECFRVQSYLFTFSNENLEKYLKFWMKTYYAPNPYVKSGDDAFIIYCELAKEILESKDLEIDYHDFFDRRIGGKSEDILMNAIKAFCSPIRYKKDPISEKNVFYVDPQNTQLLADEIQSIQTNYPINDQSSKADFFDRFSYDNFCKFYGIAAELEEVDLDENTNTDCKRITGGTNILLYGVPGAGKTLVGLDVAVKQTYRNGELDKENGAVYLSGNGPLVAVLTEALARDNQKKCAAKGEHKNLSDSRREVSEFIQIIHRYRDNMLAKIKNPVENGIVEIDPDKAIHLEHTGYGEVEHVAIFDEAQRSWTHKRIAEYLKRGGTYGNKLKVPNFPMSEAEFLIWSLDQREDWAVIVCLVGGGQEINTGEAGITEWIKALNSMFQHWEVYISDKLTDPEYAEGHVNELLQGNNRVTFAEDLHLAVSLRSFRAETLSAFVQSMLSFRSDAADLYKDVSGRGYPIVLTRDMDEARAWLRKQARGTQQTGVLVTKVAARFKPLAVHILPQDDDNAVHWFLEDKTDIRSSNYLEDAATEIQVQGLELDYACVLWDADMRYEDGYWNFYKFNGKNKWNPENNIENQKYMLNAYRVLLTRARQGIVICVPKGNNHLTPEGFPEDPTRLPEYYDGTFEYLKGLGIKELES